MSDDTIEQRIAAARRRRERRQRQRAQLEEAREHGLTARHAAKMARWADEDDDQTGGDAA